MGSLGPDPVNLHSRLPRNWRVAVGCLLLILLPYAFVIWLCFRFMPWVVDGLGSLGYQSTPVCAIGRASGDCHEELSGRVVQTYRQFSAKGGSFDHVVVRLDDARYLDVQGFEFEDAGFSVTERVVVVVWRGIPRTVTGEGHRFYSERDPMAELVVGMPLTLAGLGLGIWMFLSALIPIIRYLVTGRD